MMMRTGPRAPLLVIEAQFVFEFATVMFDAPAPFGEAHQSTAPQRLCVAAGYTLGDRVIDFRSPSSNNPGSYSHAYVWRSTRLSEAPKSPGNCNDRPSAARNMQILT